MSEAIRDRVARAEGWTWYADAGVWQHKDHSEWQVAHPIPDTLDACAEAWDRHAGGVHWGRAIMFNMWAANMGEERYIEIKPTGTDAASELRDRWEFLDKVMKEKGVV